VDDDSLQAAINAIVTTTSHPLLIKQATARTREEAVRALLGGGQKPTASAARNPEEKVEKNC
jgi:hypothetical protein